MITNFEIVNKHMLDRYAEEHDQHYLELLNKCAEGNDTESISHRWFLESMPKRIIYHMLYGNLLFQIRDKTVLDIGGGWCSLSRLLQQRHLYVLLDLQTNGKDWSTSPCAPCDIIIANDLFPNVDQRLEIFLNKFLPKCRYMKLSLTYFNKPKWYTLKRADGDEVLTMLSWTGKQVKEVLDKYNRSKVDLNGLLENPDSLFPNGRQVAIVSLAGKL